MATLAPHAVPARLLTAEGAQLRIGGSVEIEVPWTIDLPSPRKDSVMGDHFTIEQCVILCEFIEQARQGDQNRRCSLVDVFGQLWFADYFPPHDDKEGHVQWCEPGRRRTGRRAAK